MKTIIINEGQFKRILQMNEDEVPNFDGGDLKEYPSSEVTVTNNITNSEGNKKYGKPKTTDKIQKSLTTQNYWGNPRAMRRV